MLQKIYEKTVEHLVSLCKESTDGVVVGLRYDQEDSCFLAVTQYKTGWGKGDVEMETMRVADDWVLDNYGNEVAAKLMDREAMTRFMQFLPTKDGILASFVVDNKKNCRVR